MENIPDTKAELRDKLREKIRNKSNMRHPREQQLKKSSNVMNQFKDTMSNMSNEQLIDIMTDEYMKEHAKTHPNSIDPTKRSYYKKEIAKLLEKEQKLNKK